jgi:hypothetical protein
LEIASNRQFQFREMQYSSPQNSFEKKGYLPHSSKHGMTAEAGAQGPKSKLSNSFLHLMA